MNELETARAIASGELRSPQKFAGFVFWAIRITSTGTAERHALNEKVWRDPAVWLTRETLARVSALPVIGLHPGEELDGAEYDKRSVGTVQYPYIADAEGVQNAAGPDIWAVCRIYNASMIECLAKERWSTSPSVVFTKTDGSQTVQLSDGSHLLLEADPTLLCHIAIVPNGVWDRDGPPTGVRSDANFNESDHPSESGGKFTEGAGTSRSALSKPVNWRKADDPDPDDEEIETPKDVVMMLGFDPAKEGGSSSERTDIMAEETEAEKEAREKKEREDKSRRDAAGGDIDKVLTHLDAMSKRMDAWEAADKARKDAESKEKERSDAKARRDAEREPWMKADAAECATDDAAEEAEAKEMEAKGEPAETAADKARAARKDRMDARRKDAAYLADKAKKDAAEKEVREDAARKDAQAVADKERAERIAADAAAIAKGLSMMPMRHDATEYAAMADAQARADAQAYQPLGQQAPGPLQGETAPAYRVRLARGVQKHSKPWSGVDLHALQDAAFTIAEGQIYADAAAASRSSDDIAEGVLIPVTRRLPGGHEVTEFRGRTTIFKQFAMPANAVTKFHTERRA
jgi:hypothetical protein